MSVEFLCSDSNSPVFVFQIQGKENLSDWSRGRSQPLDCFSKATETVTSQTWSMERFPKEWVNDSKIGKNLHKSKTTIQSKPFLIQAAGLLEQTLPVGWSTLLLSPFALHLNASHCFTLGKYFQFLTSQDAITPSAFHIISHNFSLE